METKDSHVLIRPATAHDAGGIDEIYNHYVVNSTATYQTEPGTLVERRAWMEAHDAAHPIVVAEWGGEIVGWGALSRFHARAAYARTVENSVYIREGFHGRGIGSQLLKHLIGLAGELGHHTIIAGISADQEPSVRLHKKFGFQEAALLKEVGYKFDRWLDVAYLQLVISEGTKK